MSVSSQQVFQFIQTNWLALLSLVVALLGGVRGLIDIRNWHRSYARMAAYMKHLTLIDAKDTSGNPYVGLILDIAIGNPGNEALTPLAFQLDCKIDSRWIRFTKSSIPEGFIVNKDSGVREFKDVNKNDIGIFAHAIKRDTPAIGFLVFASSVVDMEKLKLQHLTMPMRLSCVDLFGKTHKIKLNSDLSSDLR